MCVPCVHYEELLSLDVILTLDSFRFFQTALDHSRPMTSCHVTSQSCAFSLLLQTNNYYYYILTLTLKSVHTFVLQQEYYLRFFLKEDFKCPCSLCSIESRRHILHNCMRSNNYQNLRQDTISHFMLFLEFNSSAFSFKEGITQLLCVSFQLVILLQTLSLQFSFLCSSFLFLFLFFTFHIICFYLYVVTK